MFESLRKKMANTFSLAGQAKTLTAQVQQTSITEKNAYNDGGTYSPGQPLQPQNQGHEPWQNEYRVGRNLTIAPRTEDPRLTPFQVLRTLAEQHDITAICIKMMIDQVTGDEWDIVPAKKEDKHDHDKDIDVVKAFFYKPDKVHLFNDWLKMYLNDVLPIDAGTIYKRRTRGGKLHSLEVIDGATIKPLIDAYGRVPLPPNAAYQQIIYGMPYGSAENIPGFTINDIIYRPRYPRSWTTYGFSPTEQLLMKINIMLRRDDFHLRYYTKGALPDAGLFQVDANWSPDQIAQYQELWNDVMSGNIDERLAMRFVPKGAYTATKEFKFDPKTDEWIARLVAISFGVNPQAFILAMTRATGEMQDAQQTDIGLGPLETFLEETFTDIIQNDLGFPHLRFRYIDEKNEDAKTTVERNMQYVSRGLLSIDEIRSANGLAPATDLPDGVPPYVLLGNEIVFITKDFIEAKMKAQLDALAQGNFQAGNAQTAQIKPVVSSKVKVPNGEGKSAQKSIQDELKQYEKFSLSRLKKKTKREFEPQILSVEFVKGIDSELQKCSCGDDVKKIFRELHKTVDIKDQIKEFADQLNDKMDDLRQYMFDRLDEMPEDDEKQDDKEYLLLLLLGEYDFDKEFKTVFTTMLNSYSETVFDKAEKEIKQLGEFNMTADHRKELIDSIVADRVAFLLPEIEQATKNMISANISTANNVKTLKQAITDAYAVSIDRADTIAEIEYRTIENITRVEAGKGSDVVGGVLVSDGTDHDSFCFEANGQVWSLDFAGANILQHPNCVRQFTFMSVEEVEDYGGVDVE